MNAHACNKLLPLSSHHILQGSESIFLSPFEPPNNQSSSMHQYAHNKFSCISENQIAGNKDAILPFS